MSTIDQHAYDLSAVSLTLRRDLTFHRQQFGAHSCYVVEDASRSMFFRIGEVEYVFLSLLDGRTSIAAAVAEVATLRGADALSESAAAAFCSWLMEQQLATTPESHTADRYIRRARRQQTAKRWQWLNPIMLRLPCGNPNEIIRALASGLSWLFGPIGLGIWLPTVLIGLWCLLSSWSQITSHHAVLSADNGLWLALTWLGLKLLHELAHGLVCRRYGGETREAGVILLLFVPLPYVDVTSSWRFGSRWQRAWTAAAGMYAEVFVAAMAAIIFSASDSAIVRFHAVNILTSAGLMTLLFNLNPLMRFDGYYILADACGLPNLATHGQQDLLWFARRVFLGVQTPRPVWPEGRAWLIRLYGIAAFAWKLTLCVSLTAAAALMFHGAGIILAAIAVVLWIAVPVWRFVVYLIKGDPIQPPRRWRFLGIVAASLTAIAAVLHWVPWIERQRYPAVVDYDPVTTVRTSVPGFVTALHVTSGQWVEAGDLLLTLENSELTASITDVYLSLQQSEHDAARYHRQAELAAFQVERENQRALRQRLQELEKQQRHLMVRSPSSGRLLTANLPDLMGQWMSAGTELALVGDEQRRTLHFTAAQTDLPALQAGEGRPVRVHIWGQTTADLVGIVAAVDPRASTTVRFPSLTSAAGGPLTVRGTTVASQDRTETSSAAPPQWELLEPHFCGTVRLSSQQLNQLGTGQTGYIELRAHRGSVGQVLKTALRTHFLDHEVSRQ